MALTFCDGFDAYAAPQILAKWTNEIGATVSFAGPGRLGYGQYLVLNGGAGGSLQRALPAAVTTIITGFAYYNPNSAINNTPILGFSDNVNGPLGTVQTTTSAQLVYVNSAGTAVATSLPGLLSAQAWCYVEVQITFSNTSTGSVTIRLNGQTVVSIASINTSGTNPNPCAIIALSAYNTQQYFDDVYVLNTTAPNNAFLGDVKILPLYPTGNGRVSGFTRFGGSASGNYTAVNDVPPDGDTSYVYTSTPGTSDAYTITTLSNVTTIKAVQVSAYARKDDTPSRVLGLGVGNGTTENYDAGHSLNTTYTYVLRQMDTNPLTSAAWAPGDFPTLQLAQTLVS